MTLDVMPIDVDAQVDDLPELALIAQYRDGDSSVRFAFLDPALLMPSDINRTFDEPGALDDLLASIPVVGILQALVVTRVADREDAYRILIGHRRHAAALKLGLAIVPCLIVASDGAAQEILSILAENDDRLSLKPSQKAELYHQLTLLDWQPAQIAKARGVRTSEVRAALTLHQLPAAVHEAADDGQLTLDLAAELAEFTDDPKTLAKIMDKGRGTWGFRHAISDARDRRVRNAAADRIFAELTLAGVKVVPTPRDFGYGSKQAALHTLLDANGAPLDPETVKTQPGIFAYIDKQAYGGPQAILFCSDPETFGYVRRVSNGYVSEAERARQAAEAETRAARRAALELAADVRREFLVATFANPKAAKKHHVEALRDAMVDPGRLTYPGQLAELADSIAGASIADTASSAGADRLSRILVARWITSREHQLAELSNGRTWAADTTYVAAHLTRLVELGYELSEAEQSLLAEIQPHDDGTGDDIESDEKIEDDE
ncbi:ParB/RepB/Spo0J family partition protein [Hamadaea sp. NPDC051192]|uniref:ParB/RepB/Spo0J family partition protein n=1 Tax=Hamadaea sp. NPDC051192 TaxID=3154940 RepID=UPI00341D8A42